MSSTTATQQELGTNGPRQQEQRRSGENGLNQKKHNKNNSKKESDDTDVMMSRLTDYLFLPLFAILQGQDVPLSWLSLSSSRSPPQQHQLQLWHHQKQEGEGRIRIRRSAVWKCVSRAAKAMVATLDLIVTATTMTAVPQSTILDILRRVVPKCLVACATALPSGKDIAAVQQQRQAESSSSCLDCGHDCIHDLLQATIGILQLVTKLKKHATTAVAIGVQEEIADTLDGALAARMVDANLALAVVQQEETSLQSQPESSSSSSPVVVFPTFVQESALLATHTWMQVIPLAETWQNIFPGCFTGLVRTLVQSVAGGGNNRTGRRRRDNQVVAIAALKCLSTLLRITLGGCSEDARPESTGGLNGTSSAVDILTNIATAARAAAALANPENTAASRATHTRNAQQQQQQQEERSFLDQVYARVPAPLTIVLNMLLNAVAGAPSSSSLTLQIQRETLVLCRVVLVESGFCWNNPDNSMLQRQKQLTQSKEALEEAVDKLTTTSMETCLVLAGSSMAEHECTSVDHDDQTNHRGVKGLAREILYTHNNNNLDSRDRHNRILSRIFSILEQLPILVERPLLSSSNEQQRCSELRTNLKLIAGYFRLLTTTTSKSTETSCQNNKQLRTTMVSDAVATKLQRVLVKVFTVDFDSLEPQASNASIVGSETLLSLLLQSATSRIHHRQKTFTNHATLAPLKYRYLTDPQTQQDAVDLVRALGSLLGPKHGAIFVDACVANLFESCTAVATPEQQDVEQKHFTGPGLGQRRRQRVEWLGAWIGILPLAEHVATGSFSVRKQQQLAVETVEAIKREQNGKSSKEDKKRTRYLVKLISSILPVLTSRPLWGDDDLDDDDNDRDMTETRTRNMDSSHLLAASNGHASACSPLPIVVGHDDRKNHEEAGCLAAARRRGDACLLLQLLSVIGTLFELLPLDSDDGEQARSFVSVVLYPILEIATKYQAPGRCGGANTSRVVLETAVLVLGKMAVSCHYGGDTAALVLAHVDTLFASILGRLRVPGGRSLPLLLGREEGKDHQSGVVVLDQGILDVAQITSTLLQLVAVRHGRNNNTTKRGTHNDTSCSEKCTVWLSWIEELVRVFMTRFDHANVYLQDAPEQTLVFVQLFRAALDYLKVCFGVEEKNTSNKDNKDVHTDGDAVSPTSPWLELLAPYRLSQENQKGGGGGEEEEGGEDCELSFLSAKEGFELHSKKSQSVRDKTRMPTHDRVERSSSSSHDDDDDALVVVTQRETDLIALILSRCCYLLSHASLKVQIQTCQALMSGFVVLGGVAAEHQPNKPIEGESSSESNDDDADEGEVNGPSTACLRQISTFWPAIRARLKNTCDHTSKATTTASLLVIVPSSSSTSNSPGPNILGEQTVFLAELFDLIAVMVECTRDDFMASRFRHDVWPCVGQVLGSALSSSSFDAPGADSLQGRRAAPRVLSNSERKLVASVLQCLARVFGNRPTGLALAGLIPSAGAMVLPFLDSETSVNHFCREEEEEEDAVESACWLALTNMIRIDCDALWRPLLELCELPIPPCPLSYSFNRNSTCSDGTGQNTPPAPPPPHKGKLARKAQELIEFIESLPEQPI